MENQEQDLKKKVQPLQIPTLNFMSNIQKMVREAKFSEEFGWLLKSIVASYVQGKGRITIEQRSLDLAKRFLADGLILEDKITTYFFEVMVLVPDQVCASNPMFLQLVPSQFDGKLKRLDE